MKDPIRQRAKTVALHTHRHLFLTGKAGTGKTTLLHEILKETDKNTVVVAPTGVAAIQAGGMTIHSFFQLPTSSFLPVEIDRTQPDLAIDRQLLVKNQKIRKERIQLYLELELLIVDEVSMVRSDVLDAMDFTLRRFRKDSNPFGGVQVLLIGDLYQLSPVVNPRDVPLLRNYYDSSFFFDSHVWPKMQALTIELTTVYRQEEVAFVNLLNAIRDGQKEALDLEILNKRYQPNVTADGAIVLTTHNRKAEQINQHELGQLKNPSFELRAEIVGSFSESAYPVEARIVLKKGARVMFIRNHPDGLYYNGKIGTVISYQEEIVQVLGDEDSQPIAVEPSEWKNNRYVLNSESKEVEVKELGSFQQYPLRLAWAVTVHKSQGLTFDRVVLDLKDTFAAGQLYVALSRCRTLDGILLTSPITEKLIMTDPRIQRFFYHIAQIENWDELIQKEQESYTLQQLQRAFALHARRHYFELWEDSILKEEIQKAADAILLQRELVSSWEKLSEVGSKFQAEISHKYQRTLPDHYMPDRIRKAIGYFTQYTYKNIIQPLQDHYIAAKKDKESRRYLKSVEGLLDEFWSRMALWYSLKWKGQKLWEGKDRFQRDAQAAKKKKRKVGETFEITLQLYKEGLSFAEIAERRGLVESTIRGHLRRWIASGDIPILDVMTGDRLRSILPIIEANPDMASSDLKALLPADTEYYEISWVKAHLDAKQNNNITIKN